MKKILAIITIVASLGLAACSHENPLQKQPEENMVHFLRDSSEYAAKKMNYKGSWGDAYLYCMEGDLNKDADFCPKLYGHMIEFSKKLGSQFKDLTVEDLTDKQLFDSKIKNSAYVFNSIPFN